MQYSGPGMRLACLVVVAALAAVGCTHPRPEPGVFGEEASTVPRESGRTPAPATHRSDTKGRVTQEVARGRVLGTKGPDILMMESLTLTLRVYLRSGSAPEVLDRVVTITAPTAEMDRKTRDALFRGGVSIVMTDAKGAREGTITVDDVRWRADNHSLSTDGRVVVRRPGLAARGTGLRGDVVSATFEILNDVTVVTDK
jgi:hypothetical protein